MHGASQIKVNFVDVLDKEFAQTIYNLEYQHESHVFDQPISHVHTHWINFGRIAV